MPQTMSRFWTSNSRRFGLETQRFGLHKWQGLCVYAQNDGKLLDIELTVMEIWVLLRKVSLRLHVVHGEPVLAGPFDVFSLESREKHSGDTFASSEILL